MAMASWTSSSSESDADHDISQHRAGRLEEGERAGLEKERRLWNRISPRFYRGWPSGFHSGNLGLTPGWRPGRTRRSRCTVKDSRTTAPCSRSSPTSTTARVSADPPRRSQQVAHVPQDRYRNYKDYARQTRCGCLPQKDLRRRGGQERLHLRHDLGEEQRDGTSRGAASDRAQMARLRSARILMSMETATHFAMLGTSMASSRKSQDDAANGLYLRGDGKGHFTSRTGTESGFLRPRTSARTSSAFAREQEVCT